MAKSRSLTMKTNIKKRRLALFESVTLASGFTRERVLERYLVQHRGSLDKPALRLLD